MNRIPPGRTVGRRAGDPQIAAMRDACERGVTE